MDAARLRWLELMVSRVLSERDRTPVSDRHAEWIVVVDLEHGAWWVREDAIRDAEEVLDGDRVALVRYLARCRE